MPDPYNFFNINVHNYYFKCMNIYSKDNNIKSKNDYNIYKLGPINNNYNVLCLIDNFSIQIKDIFDRSPNSIVPGSLIKVNNFEILYKTYDNKNIVAKYLLKVNKFLHSNIESIALKVIRILEKDLNVYLNPYNFVLYRNLKINNNLINDKLFGIGSWNYHCDYDPPFKIKIFIYLSDVDENKAPFEIIFHPEKKIYPKMIPFGDKLWEWGLINVNFDQNIDKPYFTNINNLQNVLIINPNTRVPKDIIQKLEKEGFIKKKIIGKKGTMFACQAGLVHKANVGIDSYRDILVLECVPSTYKINKSNINLNNKDSKLFYENLYK